MGRQVLASLRGRGHEVHAVSRNPAEVGDRAVEWHAIDLLDQGATEALVQRVAPTHLVHLAWCSEHGVYWESPENEHWLAAGVSLLEDFVAAGGRRAVLAGTCAEYDWSCAEAPLSETATPLAPRGAYGRAKDSLRREVEALGARSGLRFAWARLFFLFGPAEHPDRLVASVARAVLSGQTADCTEGRQVRDYLPSTEVAEAIVAVLESGVSGAINLGSGVPISVRELIELVGAAAGGEERLRFGAIPFRADEPLRIVADVDRLAREVGWRPRRTLEQAVVETVEWWRERAPA